MSIYTRTGDNGSTSLFGGKRVLKCEQLIDVNGSLDELNSWIGFISSQIKIRNDKEFLHAIQGDLFTIGTALAGKEIPLAPLDSMVKAMEARIDMLEKKLPKVSHFILPGGSRLGAIMHIARSICRRVERQTVKLYTKEKRMVQTTQRVIDTNMNSIIRYLNRLSDLFFMLARFINQQRGVEEKIWQENV